MGPGAICPMGAQAYRGDDPRRNPDSSKNTNRRTSKLGWLSRNDSRLATTSSRSRSRAVGVVFFVTPTDLAKSPADGGSLNRGTSFFGPIASSILPCGVWKRFSMSAKPVQIDLWLATRSRHIAQDIAGFSMQTNQPVDGRLAHPEQLGGLYKGARQPFLIGLNDFSTNRNRNHLCV